MDYALYRQVFRRILESNVVDHHSVPSITQKNYDFICDGQFQLIIPPNQQINYHFGQYGVLVVGKEPADAAEMLIKRKKDWNRKLHQIQKNVDHNDLKTLRKMKHTKPMNISLGLRQYLEHMKTDPLAGFEDNRNWLYSGGTVKAITNQDDNALVFCSGRGLSEISVMPFSPNDEATLMTNKLKMDQPILQLDVEPGNALICVRQKNNITVVKRDGANLQVAGKKKIRKSRYFTSCALKNDLVAMSKNLGKLTLFDVNVNQLTYVKEAGEIRLNACPGQRAWTQLHWLDQKLLVVRNKDLTVMDPRSGKFVWNLTESLNDCEDICNFVKPDGRPDNLGYVATNHNLFEVDLRQDTFLQKWAHLMKNEPSFGQAIRNDEGEAVVLQSSSSAEAVMIGVGAPRLMPGVTEGLRDAQLHGICLDPEVAKRVRYNVTGTQFLPCGDSIKQVTQNAGGDVYLRDIRYSEMVEDDELRRESWREMEQTAPIATDCHQSDILSMTHALNALRLPQESQPRLAEVFWPHGQKFVPEALTAFKDNMVEPLLEIWNVPAAAEVDPMDAEEVLGKSKVEAWLQHHTLLEE